MSQDDFIVANQGFPAFRSDLNANLQALASTSSGATAPSTTYANQLWYDTANDILKIRNEANSAWINVITLDQTNNKNSSITVPTIDSGTSTALTLKSGGTTAATIDTNQNINAVNTVVMSSPYTMRNKIINGAMVIDQRNAGSAQNNLASGWVYTIDRWQVYSQSSSRFSSQQNRGSVTTPTGFSNYLGLVVNTGYSVSASDYNLLQQPIEGFNIAELAWGTANAISVTLSFKVYSSLTGTHSGYISNSAFTTAYPFTFTVSSANTWTDISITISGPTTGTWPTNNTTGFVVGFNLGSGSNYQTASINSWNSSAKIQSSSALSVVATTGATFYITGVQLERGTVATPFEYRNYQQELAMCMRYYQKTDALLGVGNNTNFTGTYLFPTPMRVSPSLGILANGAYTVLGITDYVTLDHNQSSANIAIVNGTRVSSTSVSFNAGNFALTTYRYYGTRPNETAFMTISAEL